MRNPAIPVVVHLVNSLQGGGTERMLVSLLGRFDPACGRHIVVTLREAGSLAAKLPDHVACRPIGTIGRSWTAWLALARMIRQERRGTARPCILHARNTGCWYDAILASCVVPGTKLVLGFHGLDSQTTFNKHQRRAARWGLRRGALFASVSHAGKRQLHQQAGIPLEQIDVLPNGVDLDHFRSIDPDAWPQTRRRFAFDRSTLVVGVVGSLVPIKGHSTLLRAFAQAVLTAPNLGLLIVGDGPLRQPLLELAHSEGIADRVRFAGWCDDIPAMMAAMDVYICPSESEGMSNAVLEAMAAALPIIATDVGDNALVIRQAIDGLILESRSVRAMAEAIVSLARSPDQRSTFAAASRRRIQDYGFQQAVTAYQRYYRSLLGTASARWKIEDCRSPILNTQSAILNRR